MHFSSLVVLALSAVPALGARSSGCGKTPTLRSGKYNAQINGKNREYILRVPSDYNQNRAHRLIFTFHARGGTADQIANGGGGTLA